MPYVVLDAARRSPTLPLPPVGKGRMSVRMRQRRSEHAIRRGDPLDEPVLMGVGYRLRPRSDIQLVEDVGDVARRRGAADKEQFANLLIALSPSEQPQHLQFPSGQAMHG